jgi:hypothetical protein
MAAPICGMALPTHASSRAYVSTYFQLSCLHASSTTATKSLLLLQLLKLRGGKKSLKQTQYICQSSRAFAVLKEMLNISHTYKHITNRT